MAPHSVYEPFDRVWVKMEGYDWWPARIVSDAELEANGQTRPDGYDITVYFYEGTTTPATLDHLQSATTNMAFFETSSEKAVTVDNDLLAAIRRAETDETANPLKYDFPNNERGAAGKLNADAPTAATSSTARRGAHEKAQKRPVSKRTRDAADERHTQNHNNNNNNNNMGDDADSLGDVNILPDDRLAAMSDRIQSAVTASDLPTLRIELCDLDTVTVTLRQLETTRIGAAVGGILARRELDRLWPLARALISSWARAMPAETLDAIKRHQQYRLGRRQDDARNVHASDEAMVSPVLPGAPSFATIAAPPEQKQQQKQQEEESGEKARTRFVTRVRKLLDNPTDPPIPNVTAADLDAVADELCRDIVEPEDRKHLQQQLEKAGMAHLRRELATRALSGKEFLKLPQSALMTEEEKRTEEDRITKMIEEQDKVKLANVAITSLFKCPNCGKSRCSFYEQQTRSADEPTTKFLACLECKHAWTTE